MFLSFSTVYLKCITASHVLKEKSWTGDGGKFCKDLNRGQGRWRTYVWGVDWKLVRNRCALVPSGSFSNRVINRFPTMHHKMTSLWRPDRGMYVKEIEPNRYIHQFYHEVDIKRVIEGSPWTFGRFQLLFERLQPGDNPRAAVINRWISGYNCMAWILVLYCTGLYKMLETTL